MIGHRLGSYNITARLGEGAMGEVYLAHDERLDRKVAIKFLPAELTVDEGARERFAEEARAAAALDHPHIIPVYELGEHSGRLFIAMAYAEGLTLQELIETDPPDLDQALDIARQVCRGLVAAGRAGVVHRDIKPANIMVSPDGHARILDFGLARTGRAGGQAHAAVAGTASYMSPEQARGDEVDARADIWALGVTLYYLLTGRLPFEGTYDLAVIYSILHDDPVPLGEHRPELPDRVSASVMRAMSKDPAGRFATAEEFLAALEGSPSTGEKRPSKPGVVVPTEPSVAVIDFQNLKQAPEDNWISTGIAETITADLHRLPGLRVTNRQRVMEALRGSTAAADRADDTGWASELGLQLGVRWLISGTFQCLGARIRITAHFIDVTSHEIVDSAKIDGSMEEIFELQDRIVAALAGAIRLNLGTSGLEAARPDARPALSAYEYFARGRQELLHMEEGAFSRAEELLSKAIALDPHYAQAHASLGEVQLARFIRDADPHRLEEGRATLEKAIGLDPELAYAWVWLTYGYMRSGRMEDALRAGQRAIELDPHHPQGHYFLANVFNAIASRTHDQTLFEKAASHFKRCLTVSPNYQQGHMNLGMLYTRLGRYREARPHLERAMEIELSEHYDLSSFVGGLTLLGDLVSRLGDLDLAEEYYRRSLEQLERSEHVYRFLFTAHTHGSLGHVALARGEYAAALVSFGAARETARAHPEAMGIGFHYLRATIGQALAQLRLTVRDEARRAVQEAEELFASREGFDFTPSWVGSDYRVFFDLACYYAVAGDGQKALDSLEQAVDSGLTEWPLMVRSEFLQSLQAEGRFATLLDRLQMDT